MNKLKERAAKIKLLALDVDGVLSDGTLSFTAQGDEIKAFNILDGLGIKHLQRNGVEVCIITGRNSPLTARRARDLGIETILQGREDKLVALKEVCSELKIELEHVAYVGDDLPDLGAIKMSGLGFSVPNGHEFVKKYADIVTSAGGGEGAVREVSDYILDCKGLLQSVNESYLPNCKN